MAILCSFTTWLRQLLELLVLYKSFETPRLLLRPTGVQDAPFLLELMNCPKWTQFIGDRNIHNLGDAETYIREKMLPQLERLTFGSYTVISKLDGKKVGSCGLYDREGLEGIDIGFAFLPQFEGQGYALEATRRLLKAAREDFDLDSIKAITNKDNEGSKKLLKRLGLELMGEIQLEGESEKLLLYSIKLRR